MTQTIAEKRNIPDEIIDKLININK